MTKKKFILKLTCLDKAGIVAHVTTELFHLEGIIINSDQFSDPDTGQFFMRIVFEIEDTVNIQKEIEKQLLPIFKTHEITWQLSDSEHKPSVLILCSKQEHCLNHLLSKHRSGGLNIDIKAIGSNHPLLEEVASWYKIPFHHLPITPNTKKQQELQIQKLVEDQKIDYIILARYMQILSPEFCDIYKGRIINIHHSFLPGFKGANPYRQAHERGVKIIGATAHFVTDDLDEGPIIAQETIRVGHEHSVNELTRYGADIEALVLARAVKQVSEYRVFIDKNKTVVFK